MHDRLPVAAACGRAHLPLMATSGGALSSVGRAYRLHREGRRFEPVSAHHETSFRSRVGASDPSSRERKFNADQTRNRKSVGSGNSETVRVDIVGGRTSKTKNQKNTNMHKRYESK